MHDSTVARLGDWLEPGDLLVFNDTRVIPARLAGVRRRGRRRRGADRGDADRGRRRTAPGGRWPGRASGSRSATASPSAPGSPPRCATRTAPRCCSPSTATARRSRRRSTAVGEMPLPPYIAARRPADAARPRGLPDGLRRPRPARWRRPTAALHFDAALLADLAARGIGQTRADAARRRRHLPAGQGRGHRRRTGCTRMGRDRRRGRRGGGGDARRRRPGDPGRHHGAPRCSTPSTANRSLRSRASAATSPQ